jgi:ABC-type transport system substrate-binding protein
VEPCLAVDYPRKEIFTENGPGGGIRRMAYTFVLRDAVYFQDDPCFPGGKGRKVTTDDVIYSIKRLADPKVNSTGYWLVAGKIKGLDAFFERAEKAGRADYDAPVEGLQKKDDRTLRVVLTEPYPGFLYVMSMPYSAPVPREAVLYYDAPGRDGFSHHPVGTGAFRLKSWQRRHRIILERNPTYRRDAYPSRGEPGDAERGLLADAGKPIPFLDEVWYTIIGAGQPLWLLFLQGYLDASGIPKEQFDKVVTKNLDLSPVFAAIGIALEIAPELDVYYHAFNMRDPVLGKNKYLRQALALSFDTERYNEIFLNGRGIDAQGPLPPGMFGYDPSLRNPYKAHDLARARELLAKAGYPGGIDPKTGKPLELAYDIGDDSPRARDVARFTIGCFQELGIHVKLQVNTWAQHLERTHRGTFQMYSLGWIADYPDPENFLQLLYGPNRPPGPNSSSFDDPEYNRLYERMKVMEDTPERERVVHRMVAIAVEECPWVPTVHGPAYTLRHAWSFNGKNHSISGNYAKYKRVDPEARRRYRRDENRPKFAAPFAVLGLLLAAAAPAVVRRALQKRHA